MFVDWPAHSKDAFGSETLLAEHNISKSDLFSDEGLAAILDEYPRENLDIWTFGRQREGVTIAMRGRAPKMSGRDIVNAVHAGEIWLNLRRAGDEVFDLGHVAETIYDSLEDLADQRLRKKDMGLLISSPHVQVNYHLDIPMVALFHLRGRKRIWLYPVKEELAPSSYVEEIVHMKREEELPYRREFDAQAKVYDLTPGMALTWPQLAPHRIQNADSLNVSLSCEFQTVKSLINANAAYTNAFLRQTMKMSPVLTRELNASTFGKAAFAQVHKKVRRPVDRKSPTPVTFELDVTRENCIRSLVA